MLDRESTFKNEEVIELLQQRMIPVAFDQWYTRQQQDLEGEFYRRIIAQGPRRDVDRTTQGFYLADPSGELYFYDNHRGPERILRLMKFADQKFSEDSTSVFEPLAKDYQVDQQFDRTPPADVAIVRVTSKVLGGYPATEDAWKKIFQQAIGRDNLWITAAEIDSLRKDQFPESLAWRIARFHLIDNTRGEPPMWELEEVQQLDMDLSAGNIRGSVRLVTDDRRRGFAASFSGKIEFDSSDTKKLRNFEVVGRGIYWGHGRYTQQPPPGEFPFAVSFSLTDRSSAEDLVAPQATKGWNRSYLKAEKR